MRSPASSSAAVGLLGSQVVIENRGGASGNLAAENVAHSPPDGYTMFLAADFQGVNVFMFPKLSYHPVTDFAPVSMVVQYTNVFVVPISSPARTLQEFIAHAKTKQLTFASPGHGVSGHMAGELFMREAGIKLQVPPNPLPIRHPGSDPGTRRLLRQQLSPLISLHRRAGATALTSLAVAAGTGDPDRGGIRPAKVRRGRLGIRYSSKPRRRRDREQDDGGTVKGWPSRARKRLEDCLSLIVRPQELANLSALHDKWGPLLKTADFGDGE